MKDQLVADSLPYNANNHHHHYNKHKSNGSHGNVNHEPRQGKPPKPHRSISWSQLLLPSYKTRLAEFRKLFAKHVPTNERLIADFSCALQREILIQGRLYLSVNYLSFHANIFGWETVVSIKLAEVTALTKTNTIRVIPNAMQIIMDSGQKYIFTSFVARDKAFKRVYRLWQDVVIGQKMSVSEVWELIHYNYGNDLGVPSDDSEPDDDEELSVVTRNNMNIVEEELIDDDVFDSSGHNGPHRRLRLPMARESITSYLTCPESAVAAALEEQLNQLDGQSLISDNNNNNSHNNSTYGKNRWTNNKLIKSFLTYTTRESCYLRVILVLSVLLLLTHLIVLYKLWKVNDRVSNGGGDYNHHGGNGEHHNVVDEKVLDSLRQLADITTRLVSSKAFAKLA